MAMRWLASPALVLVLLGSMAGCGGGGSATQTPFERGYQRQEENAPGQEAAAQEREGEESRENKEMCERGEIFRDRERFDGSAQC
jgi:hypothetical protein